MKTRRRSVFVVCVLAVGASFLAGCSATGRTAGTDPGASTGPSAGASASERTYSARDLANILDRAGTALGVDGTLVTDSELKDAAAKVGGAAGLAQLLGGSNVTYSPQACGDLLATAMQGGVPEDAIAAQFRTSTGAVTAASFAGKPLTSAQKASWTTTVDSVLDQCGTVSLSFEVAGKSVSAKVTTAKATATTTADTTVGLRQTMSIEAAGQNLSAVSTVVQAVWGNLLISATTIATDQTTDAQAQAKTVTPEAAVDAVVAAAKR